MQPDTNTKTKTKQMPNKYVVPVTELIGAHNITIDFFTSWFRDYYNGDVASSKISNPSFVSIVGPHGTGKTTLAMSLLYHLRCRVRRVNTRAAETERAVENAVSAILVHEETRTRVTHAILIDNLETITSVIEHAFVRCLIQTNDVMRVMPIILVMNKHCSSTYSKTLIIARSIRIPVPTYENMEVLALTICDREHVYPADDAALRIMIEHADFDFNVLVTLVFDLARRFGRGKQIAAKLIRDHVGHLKQKDRDPDIYETTSSLLTRYQSINRCCELYNSEKATLPLMIYENYHHVVSHEMTDASTRFADAQRIIDALAVGDQIESFMYTNQNGDLRNSHAVLSCAYPSFHLSDMAVAYKIPRNDMHVSYPIRYPKASARSTAKKNAGASCFSGFGPDENAAINLLFKLLVRDARYESCADILREYGVDVAAFSAFMKSDKTTTLDVTQARERRIAGFM